jgi:Tol biopolymer transport system component
MTTPERLERELPAILADLVTGSAPDYLDDVFAQTARIRQRPAWTFPERWLPVSSLSRLVAAPPVRWRTIGLIALLILALAAAAILVAGSRRPRVPAPFGPASNGPIVYSWLGDVYVRDTFTAEPRLLVGGPDEDAIAGYSRDGTKMAFFRKVGTLDDLWLAGADGSNPIRLGGPFNRTADPLPWDAFDWSPSGDLIAVSHVADGKGVLDLVRTDGGGATRVDVGLEAADPAWRPGESGQLAFRGFGPGSQAVFLWQSGGSEPVRLALDEGPDSDADDFKNLAWAPGGDRLTYTTVDDGWYRLRVATIAPAGELVDQHRVTASATLQHEYQPIWLPDGNQLVYLLAFAINNVDQVHVVIGPPDGGQARDLGLDGQEFIVSVSPDGKSILALDHATNEVSQVDLDTFEITKGFRADWSTTLAPNRQRLAP